MQKPRYIKKNKKQTGHNKKKASRINQPPENIHAGKLTFITSAAHEISFLNLYKTTSRRVPNSMETVLFSN